MSSLVSRRLFLYLPFLLSSLLSSTASAAYLNISARYPFPRNFKRTFDINRDDFLSENPDIDLKYAPSPTDYDNGIQTILRDSITSGLPNVEFIGLRHLRVIKNQDIAIDLSPLMAADNSTFKDQGWSDNLAALGRIDGKQIGLPFALSMPVLFVNMNLIKKAGHNSTAIPRRWDDVIGLAKLISKVDPSTAGIYQAYIGFNATWYFLGLVYGANGEIITVKDGKVDLGNIAAISALKLYRRMVSEAAMPMITEESARMQFLAGKIGMFVDSAARITSYQKATEGQFELRTAFYPTPDGQQRKLIAGGSVGILTNQANKDPKVLQAAWRFLKFACGPQGTTNLIKNAGYTPTNTIALGNPRYLGGYFDSNPLYEVPLAQLSMLVPWYQFPGSNGIEISNVIAENIEKYLNNNQITAEASIDMMEKQIAKLL